MLSCNALSQPHFDYATSAWYLNLTQKNEKQNPNYTQKNAFGIVCIWTKWPIFELACLSNLRIRNSFPR